MSLGLVIRSLAAFSTVAILAARADTPPAAASARFAATSDVWQSIRNDAVSKLAGGDPAQIATAVSSLHAAAMRLTSRQDLPVLVLIDAKRYDDAEQLAAEVTISQASSPHTFAVAEKLRAQAFLAQHKFPEALSAARSYYDAAPLADSSGAVNLVAVCLTLGHPDDPALAKRFKSQQVAWATTGQTQAASAAQISPSVVPTSEPSGSPPAQPAPTDPLGDPILATIPPDDKPFTAAADARELVDYPDFVAKGNLLLLSGRAKEARSVFERAETAAPDSKAVDAIENVARAIRAESGCVGPANAYILQRQGAP